MSALAVAFVIGFAAGVFAVLVLTMISAAHDYEDDHQ
jgi:hypothetical protein